MYKFRIHHGIGLICLAVASCKVPAIVQTNENKSVLQAYSDNKDTSNMAAMQWRSFFTDQNLVSLIDTALKNNQELKITLQEIEIARNEIRAKQGPLLPSVTAGAGIGVEKVGRYTSQGAGDASTDITPGKEVPDALMNYMIGVNATWEIDIWKKLRNARKAAVTRYLSTVEG